MSDVEITTGDLLRAESGLEGATPIVERAMDGAVGTAAAAIRDNVRAAGRRHRKTGRMDAAIVVRPLPVGVEVVAGDVANLIVSGTAPHLIRPHRKALRLAGASHPFAAIVHHPGTAPDPFVARGIEASQADVLQALEDAGTEIVHNLASSLGGS